ncbi:act minimal PKS acyl carrier protein [Kutzneria viridogrisea]|nr:acyl carrier protein [Kutzneria albida]MBA8926440.1 act minimal PKS acyl carrier protein [Kutzneria viridogrisea]
MTCTDLVAIIRECAGDSDTADLDGDILDVSFEELGYDSLAMLETAGQTQRRYGITLDDDVVVEAKTPREFLDLVNGKLVAAA